MSTGPVESVREGRLPPLAWCEHPDCPPVIAQADEDTPDALVAMQAVARGHADETGHDAGVDYATLRIRYRRQEATS